MSKHPKLGHQPQPSKNPHAASSPESFYTLNPSWRVGRLELADPFGWHVLDNAKLHDIRSKLASFESKTWNEILVIEHSQNHEVEVSKLCSDARKRLATLHLDDIDKLVSLRLSGKERVWGIRDADVLQLLW